MKAHRPQIVALASVAAFAVLGTGLGALATSAFRHNYRPSAGGNYALTGGVRSDLPSSKRVNASLTGVARGLSYGTYLGGSSDDVAYATATDAAGNSYIAGYTLSTDLPTTTGAYQTTYQGGAADIFVSKFSPAGVLLYTTYIGGSGEDVAFGIAADSSGNAYVTGYTTSTDFPITNGAYKSTYQGGGGDAFVLELNAAGNALVYSTYLGGPGDDFAYGIALDSSNEATVTGSTDSVKFPVSGGAVQSANGGGITDAFVVRLNAAGSALVYSTYLGGSGEDVGYGVAVDSGGDAYITGYTQSADFPVTAGAAQGTFGGVYDAFVTTVNPTGTAQLYSTYLGGSGQDYGFGIAVDSSANAYITGYTVSTDYPVTTGAFQTVEAGGYDAVLTKLTSTGAIAYSTFVGRSGDDFGLAIAVDSAGNAFITGQTSSTDFPAAGPVQSGINGAVDAFITSVNTTGTALNYSTWLGGSGFDIGYGIALNSAKTAYVAGYTLSSDFPVTSNAAQSVLAGAGDAFLVALPPPPLLAIVKSHTGNFSQGQNGATYSISVSNVGLAASSGTVMVTDVLPAGLTATDMSGTGWTCMLATLVCTRSEALSSGAGYAAITVTVNVAANAAALVTNQATVSGGGSASATANDPTTVAVELIPQTISFAPLPNVAVGSAPFQITAVASSGLTVGFISNTLSVCTVSGNTVTVLIGGGCSITATQAGNSMYSAATPVTQRFTVPFSDVSPADNLYNEVNAFAQYGITSGCGTNAFCPTESVTRDEMAIFIVRAIYGSDNFSYTAIPYFSDVTPSTFGFKWIQKLKDLGITSGCTPTTYCPSEVVTRDQMAVFIIRARLGVSIAGPSPTFTYPSVAYFTDATVANEFAFPWIQRMKLENITNGCTATTYCSSAPVTREEMATFIMRGAFNQFLPAGTPVISQISPATLAVGASGTFTVIGLNTNFVQGTTVVSPIPGVTIGAVTVASPTSLTVQLTAASNAVAQPYSILAVTDSEQDVLPNGLLLQ